MTESTTRLHIAPLTPALLDSILVPSIRPLATQISFHTISTFPENNYGFVSLPSMEADKLKKKLNGSILKGKKLKVEVARPDPSKNNAKTEDETDQTPKKSKKTSKRKAEDSVLEGYELPVERKVKRGWTEPASAKKFKKQSKADREAKTSKPQSKSKFTENAECLFKTKLPPNKTPGTTSKKNTKYKKSNNPNEVVVHEFSQTVSHPSFLKSTTGAKPATAGFLEGKGWIDEDGNIQETINKKSRTADHHPGKRDGAKERATKKTVKKAKIETSESESQKDLDSDWTSSSGPTDSETSVSESESDNDSESEDSSNSDTSSVKKTASFANTKVGKLTVGNKAAAQTEAEASDSNSEDSEDDESDQSENGSGVDRKIESSAPSAAVEAAATKKEVHPLEALFKHANPDEKPPLDTDNTFTFFTGDDDDIEEEESIRPETLGPLTPYTKQDRQIRSLRSGAPTPDTALFPRHRSFPAGESDEDEDMDDVEDDEAHDAHDQAPEATPSKSRSQDSSQKQPEESDFVKWFWENRGENNRAWKRRRREVAKEKRQRENRRKGLKGRG